jgi:sensor histidine kinase YesM
MNIKIDHYKRPGVIERIGDWLHGAKAAWDEAERQELTRQIIRAERKIKRLYDQNRQLERELCKYEN